MIESPEYYSDMNSRPGNMLERKFYLETHRLHEMVGAREKPCSSRKDAEHAEKTKKQREKKAAKYVSLAILAT